MTTSVRVDISLGDGMAAKDGSTPTIDDVMEQCDLTDLATGEGVDRKWATLEPDMWLLDGNYHLLPEAAGSADVGVISETISGVDGSFDVPPELTITFDADYDLVSHIQFVFSEQTEVYCDDLDIEFYDVGDVLLDSQNYTPNGYEYLAELPTKPIENVRYIVITFNSTNDPYRHLRLTDILIDLLSFEGADVKEARIVEEIDPVSISMPNNVFECAIHSDNAEFSILNPDGLFFSIGENQIIEVYAIIDDVENYMGRFYLKRWEAVSENLMQFEAVDAIALLDEIDFIGGAWIDIATVYYGFDHINADDLLDLIMTNVSTDYDLDASLQNIEMNGVLFKGSVRDALQQYCFALNAYATCARDSKINIVHASIPTAGSTILGPSDVSSKKMSLLPPVSDVEINYWKRITVDTLYFDDLGAEHASVRLFTGSITPGDYILFMKEIIQEYEIAGGSTATVTNVVQNGVYFSFTCTVGGTFTLYSWGYYDIRRDRYRSIGTGEENILTISEPMLLMHVSDYATVADFIYDFMQQKYKYEFRTFGRTEKVGDQIGAITTKLDKQIVGTITRLEIDLARGVLSDVVLVGNIQDIQVLEPGKYDDREFVDDWTDGTGSLTTYPVGYLNTQTETQDVPQSYLAFVIHGTSFDIGYIGWNDVQELHIQIDGGTQIDVDTNTGSGTKTAEIWSSDTLDEGYHTVRIWGGGGGGEYVLFDYIEVFE